MPWFTRIAPGADGEPVKDWIPDDQIERAASSGLYDIGEDITVTLRNDRTGLVTQATFGDAKQYTQGEERLESEAERFDRQEQARIEEEHGDLAGKAATVIEGAANAATLGGYDYVGGKLFGDDFRTRRKEEIQANQVENIAGEVLGYMAPGALAKTGGLLGKVARNTPAAIAERLAAKVASTGAKGSLLEAVAAKGIGYGLEGGIVGAGETLSEYALATTELERERAMSNLGSNVLFGAGVGAGLGAGSEFVSRGVRKAKKLADDMAEMASKRVKEVADVPEDLRGLDYAELDAIKTAEVDRLGAEIVDRSDAYHRLSQEVDPMLLGTNKRTLAKAKRMRSSALSNKKNLKRRPISFLRSLEEEEQALMEILESQDDILAKLAREDELSLKRLSKMDGFTLKNKDARKFADFTGRNLSKDAAKEGIEVTAEELQSFKEALAGNQIKGARAKSLEQIPSLLDANRAQQTLINDTIDGAAGRLGDVKAAELALKSGGGKKTFLENTAENAVYGATVGLMSSVVPFPVAALAASKVSGKISDLVLGRMSKAASKTASRSADVAKRFVDVGAKTMEKAPPLATKVLAGVRFAEKTPPLPATLPKARLVREFKAREAEIYSQVTMGPNGITMHPEARRKVGERLSGVRAVSPELADSLETMANRKISFLAEKLPKKPDFLANAVGPDDWHPGNEAIRAFARYMAAVEDPDGVEDRLADATITPQDVEAYRAVYPERYQALRMDIAQRLPELQAHLPISKRMALSIFTGLNVEPTMDPRIFSRMQAQFEDEPGTEGGMQAPKPNPTFGAFGSARSQEKTRAQKRSE